MIRGHCEVKKIDLRQWNDVDDGVAAEGPKRKKTRWRQ
ncbi:hypothetical protein SLEP1_g46432 [Rubroshorea leprosula]|uniref:Uncharacterized protein n=1 Tax=Rubroshorea leprosula TaxID=152421 RepID=A0AAV5LNZ8_9ROSI|nr:hypothetical protein SLEP1_g46432 [Rubroshorea leprosula]